MVGANCPYEFKTRQEAEDFMLRVYTDHVANGGDPLATPVAFIIEASKVTPYRRIGYGLGRKIGATLATCPLTRKEGS